MPLLLVKLQPTCKLLRSVYQVNLQLLATKSALNLLVLALTLLKQLFDKFQSTYQLLLKIPPHNHDILKLIMAGIVL